MRVSNYSDYLQQVTALIGTSTSDLQTDELTFLNVFFNKGLRDIWERGNWTDLTPYGEVRFPANLVSYPNDLTQSNWTITNATAASSAIQNPLDNRLTASLLTETATSGTHGFSQTFIAVPQTTYQAQGYFRPSGDNYINVILTDGVSTYTTMFSGVSGSIVTSTGSGVMAQANLQANGFYYWSLSANAVTGALNGNLTVQLSPDGVNTSYTGTTSNGAYFWGTTLSTPASQVPAAFYIPWEQSGESAFDVVYEAWLTDPGSFLPPYRADFNLTPQGLELIGPTIVGPVYMYYRYRRPLFTGSTYATGTAYSSGTTVYYTSTTSGYSNYYFSTTAVSANLTPDTNPSYWSMLQVPYVFLQYIVYSAYADWLLTEGQHAKAQMMKQEAQSYMDNEFDRLERQQGNVQPWKVYTHLTSQNRGLGYVGQNFNVGTATIN